MLGIMSDSKEKEIHWHAPEFEYRDKGELWYLGVIVLTAILVLIALWQRNYLFALFVGIAGALVISWGRRFPATLKFSVEEHGIRIDAIKFHSWGELESFAVHERQDELSEIFLKKRRRSPNPLIRIYAYTDELGKIRERLAEHLPEEEHEESLVDSLERIVRF